MSIPPREHPYTSISFGTNALARIEAADQRRLQAELPNDLKAWARAKESVCSWGREMKTNTEKQIVLRPMSLPRLH